MEEWTKRVGLSGLLTGTMASLLSTAALAALARIDGKGALQPTNATSHWFHGAQASEHTEMDAAHTLVGYALHHASAVFWALPFEAWLSIRPPRSSAGLIRDAMMMASIAAAVDYGVTPKRLSPGWELVLSKTSMFMAFGALAIGLAAGAVVTQTVRDRASSGIDGY